MTHYTIGKRTKKPRRRSPMVYTAFVIEPGAYRCVSVGPMLMSREQLQAWADGAQITMKFVPLKRFSGGN